MPVGLLILALDIYCAVHCLKNCRTRSWLFIILFFPMVGSLVYFFVEIFPDLQARQRRSPLVRESSVRKGSAKEIEHLKDELKLCNTVKNRELLADAYARQGRYADAIAEYEACLEGFHAKDTGLLYKYAEASFAQGDHRRCWELINQYQQQTQSRHAESQLLKARCHEFLQEYDQARQIYQILGRGHLSLDAKGHYARFLIEQGEPAAAAPLLEEILVSAKRMSRPLQKQHKDVIAFAKQQASQVLRG